MPFDIERYKIKTMIDSGKVILIVFEFVSPTLGGESVELVKIEVQNKRQIHQAESLGYHIISYRAATCVQRVRAYNVRTCSLDGHVAF